MTLHKNGPWFVENRLLVNKYGSCTNNPSICIDKSNGCVLKCGDAEMVCNYGATAIDAYNKVGWTEQAESITVITFDRYGFLNIEDICTLMNYMQNSIGVEKMQRLLSMGKDELTGEIQMLQELGF